MLIKIHRNIFCELYIRMFGQWLFKRLSPLKDWPVSLNMVKILFTAASMCVVHVMFGKRNCRVINTVSRKYSSRQNLYNKRLSTYISRRFVEYKRALRLNQPTSFIIACTVSLLLAANNLFWTLLPVYKTHRDGH